MSLNELMDLTHHKPWLNTRVNSIIVDSGISFPSLSASEPVFTDSKSNLVSVAVVPIVNGGTNSNIALTNNNIMISVAGSIIEGTNFNNPTFNSVTAASTTNQLILGKTGAGQGTTTINSIAPTSSRIITLPDAGIDSNFVLSEANSTINGVKTFGSLPIMSLLSTTSLVATDGSKALTSTVSGLSPGFTGLNLSGLTASGLIATDGSKNLTSTVSGLSPGFTGLNLSGLTASSYLVTDSSKNLISGVPYLHGFLELGSSVTQTINAAATSQITYDTVVTNTFGSNLVLANSNGKMTFSNTGAVVMNILFCCQVTGNGAFTGTTTIYFDINADGNKTYAGKKDVWAAVVPVESISFVLNLNSGDYVETYISVVTNNLTFTPKLTVKQLP